MSADYTDMLAKMQMQQALQQQNSPSLFGLQAAPDPNAMAALIKHLQDQQYVAQQGNDQGEWAWARNAGQKDFARAGQNLGNILGIGQPQQQPQAPQGPAFTLPPQGGGVSAQNGSLGSDDGADPSQGPQPDATQALRAFQASVGSGSGGQQAPGVPGANVGVPVPIPNQGANPRQTMSNMILAGRAYNQSLIRSGMPPDQAKMQTLVQMSNWGYPGIEDELAKAQTTSLANQHVQGETTHNLAQARAEDANILNQQDEQKGRATTQGFEQQRINIELARLGIDRQKANAGTASTDLAAAPTPQELVIAQKMADGDMKLPDPGSRAPKAARYAYLALQLNPDLTQESYGTRQAAAKAITSGPAGNQVRSFGVAYSHLDTVEQAVNALNNGDMPTFNRLANYVAVQTGSPQPTNVDTALSMIKGELAKGIVGSHAGEADRAAMLAGVNSSSSPQQILGAAQMAKQLVLGQASGLKSQYSSSVMGKGFNFNDALPTKFRNDLAAYEAHQNGTAPNAGAPQASSKPGADGWTTMPNGVRIRVKQ